MRDEGDPAVQLGGQRARGAFVMSTSYLIQILLPKETGKGELVSQEWFESFLEELTDRFGGATSFVRSPGQGCGATTALPNATRSRLSRSGRQNFRKTIGVRSASGSSASCRRKRS
jgi:hypothetical protein